MVRRFAWVVGVVVLPMGVVASCSDPPAKPAPAVGGGPTGGGVGGGGGGDGGADSGRESGADAGACNDVAITGLLVDRIGVVGEPPVATGGTIVDGNYDLTDYSVYVGAGGVAGPTGITAKSTIRISGGKLDQAIELGGTGKTTSSTTTSSAYTATGATLAATELCPTAGGGKQLQFTANPPLLVLTDLSSKEAFTFTKR